MITTNNGTYATIVDAAKGLGGVSTKTVREWIEKGIIPQPPTIDHGVRRIRCFPPEYLERAKAAIERYKKRKVSNVARKNGQRSGTAR